MVQAARLDLIGAGLAALLLAAPAAAQAPPEPFDTLLKPRTLTTRPPLSGGADLTRPDVLSGEAPVGTDQSLLTGRPPETPCARPQTAEGEAAAARRPPRGTVAYGGAGPGEYGRYFPELAPTSPPLGTPGGYGVPGVPTAPQRPSEPRPPREALGWSDRPLVPDAMGTRPGPMTSGQESSAQDAPARRYDPSLSGAQAVPPCDGATTTGARTPQRPGSTRGP